jgi:hypothetical protein
LNSHKLRSQAAAAAAAAEGTSGCTSSTIGPSAAAAAVTGVPTVSARYPMHKPAAAAATTAAAAAAVGQEPSAELVGQWGSEPVLHHTSSTLNSSSRWDLAP